MSLQKNLKILRGCQVFGDENNIPSYLERLNLIFGNKECQLFS